MAMKTPGVYIVEKNAFPNSAVEVATAVPAFIGYTEKAVNGNESLSKKPFRISSMAEFHAFFGGSPTPAFSIKEPEGEQTPSLVIGEKKTVIKREGPSFSFYYQMLMFFSNGGGPCYIVSVGDYTKDAIDSQALIDGVEMLLKEQEPTMVVVPEAVYLDEAGCYKVEAAVLSHCGYKMRNRFALLDVFEGYKDPQTSTVITDFRTKIGDNFLDFGAAYYPWLNTSIVEDRDLSFLNFETQPLKELLEEETKKLDEKRRPLILEQINKLDELGNKPQAEGENLTDDEAAKLKIDQDMLHKTLSGVSSAYVAILKEAKRILNLLPPSAAMAGIYTMVDNTRGVWKAPANVSVNSVISPSVSLTNDDQEDLNVPLNGKAVNAIRFFIGDGIKVWGARTLDGNSLDWRYINVRRTMIMLEESVKNATKAYVFDPNVAGTWINIKSMIENFLNGIWKRGGLAGASPDDAYSVHVGLGDTMTPEDILEGILRVTILVAIVRPAEFIEITFQQQMQKS